MSESVPITVDTELKSERAPFASTMSQSGSSVLTDGSVEPLSLRQMSGADGFIRVVNCPPGEITLLRDDNKNSLKPFREALLGQSNTGVTLKLGSRDLHSSEIEIVGAGASLWKETSVENVLLAAGVEQAKIPALLELAGLAKKKNIAPRELDEISSRRLALLCSIFSKSSILFYDRPLAQTLASSGKELAELILNSSRGSGQIRIVFLGERIPPSWKGQPGVEIESADGESSRSTSYSGTSGNLMDAVHSVRSLMNGGRQLGQATPCVLTRPQHVFNQQGRVLNSEAIKCEKISNPNLSQAESPPEDTQIVGRKVGRRGTGTLVRKGDTLIRSRKDTLTGLKTLERLNRRYPLLIQLLNFKRLAFLLLSQFKSSQNICRVELASATRYSYLRRQYYVRRLIAVFAGLAILLGIAIALN